VGVNTGGSASLATVPTGAGLVAFVRAVDAAGNAAVFRSRIFIIAKDAPMLAFRAATLYSPSAWLASVPRGAGDSRKVPHWRRLSLAMNLGADDPADIPHLRVRLESSSLAPGTMTSWTNLAAAGGSATVADPGSPPGSDCPAATTLPVVESSVLNGMPAVRFAAGAAGTSRSVVVQLQVAAPADGQTLFVLARRSADGAEAGRLVAGSTFVLGRCLQPTIVCLHASHAQLTRMRSTI
jgi:hypothetical protein